MTTHVAGHCPACGHQSLTLQGTGYRGILRCGWAPCLEPFAADSILSDPEVGHVVSLRADVFTIRHPLIERLGSRLEACELHVWLVEQDEPPRAPGLWRVTLPADVVDWDQARWEPAP